MTLPNGCARAWEAMPWVLQGSAPREQGDWLARHLAECADCRVEFEQQSRLQLALSLPPENAPDPGVGLERLLARLDRPEPEQAPPQRAGGWLTRALVAAVLLQAVGIGTLGVKLWSERPVAAYRTLSQAAPPSAPGAIHVVPDPGMKLADWNALLHGLGLRVIGGPNDVGAYTVVPAGDSTGDAVRRLRAAPGIRLAEPASPAP
ncbi:zf-HC2 domain-containing protein [Fulvimonas yonginensis]|uniref:Zf-HC2 domain-containing protein n=1 Tax=Fulvimonas yonginensis TaxID=1495200 RepID=A0ABU8JBL2_9GAMM